MIGTNVRYILLRIIIVILGFGVHSANGEYKDPTTKVNVNKQTDLFEKSVEDLKGLENFIINSKDEAVEKGQNSNVVDELGFDRNQMEQESNNLKDISASDLNGRGREEMMKQDNMDLYVDYSRPLNKKHMVDAKKIASGQDELLKNLLGKLKELGVDCKSVKGDKEKELAYYLQVENVPHKETIYNKTMCEDLRNKYNCSDSVALRCVKKGTSEIKHIVVPIDEVPEHWFQDNTAAGTIMSSLFATIDSNAHSNEIMNFIISKVGKNNIIIPYQKIILVGPAAVYSIKHINIDHFYTQPTDADGMQNGKITTRFHYIEGDGGLCLEWSEDWTERCRQQ